MRSGFGTVFPEFGPAVELAEFGPAAELTEFGPAAELTEFGPPENDTVYPEYPDTLYAAAPHSATSQRDHSAVRRRPLDFGLAFSGAALRNLRKEHMKCMIFDTISVLPPAPART